MGKRGGTRVAAISALGVLAIAGIVVGVNGNSTTTTTTTVGAIHGSPITPLSEALDAGASGCGVERAAVKHLTDGYTLPTQPTTESVETLVSMAAPPVTQNSPRFAVERELVQLQNVHIVAAKQEADSDLHIIIATNTGAEMNVESPQAQCDSSSPAAGKLAAARAALDAALGQVSSQSYTPENLRATVEGVLFFDVLHGQRGAPNGVELHPVTFFQVGSAPPPPITSTPTTTISPTTTTSTVPNPPASKDDAVDELPGCTKYPGRVYWKHVKQSHCQASYFTTP